MTTLATLWLYTVTGVLLIASVLIVGFVLIVFGLGLRVALDMWRERRDGRAGA
jgi:hypothetical protein